MSIEKEGFDQSGIFTISWFPEPIPAETCLQLQRDGLQKAREYQNMQFDGVRDYRFGKFEAKGQSYTATVMGIPHSGLILHFDAGGKSFLLLKQEADEDSEKNKTGYQKLEQTFDVGS